ncbi:CHAT domain-containing protein [Solirubrobacter phytolaccae]|uniref:CHAT domain-containing protein n=1 Tax=Solirubrobacter phytolaccae TaxID=1404360 RepID=A0A9X3SAU3_9ACTN|nr:CHAT domain-containing protein [Solirubrobacter phytolaccae]MDA0182901.1 CHAT domain-containing protein [Solirubrobacter phytolaccae]
MTAAAFLDARTYRVVAVARSWADDLVVVGIFVVLAVLFGAQFNDVAFDPTVGRRLRSSDAAIVATGAQIWFPALLAGAVALACLRLGAALDDDRSPPRRVVLLLLAGALIALTAFLKLWDTPGTVVGRFAPLAVALLIVVRLPRWRDRARLRGETRAGFRPSLRALRSLNGVRVLRWCATVIPDGTFYTSGEGVEAALDEAVRVFSRHGDPRSEAYVRARAIEHCLARSGIVDAERLSRDALACSRVAREPAVLSAYALFLQSVGRDRDAADAIAQAEAVARRTPPALRSLAAQLHAELDDAPPSDPDPGRRWLRLVWQRRPAAVALELLQHVRTSRERDPEGARESAYALCEVVRAVTVHPLTELAFDEHLRMQRVRGLALETIGSIHDARGELLDAADAYTDAYEEFALIKDRTRSADVMVRAAGNLLRAGAGTSEHESHALDLVRVSFEVIERERGPLRQGASRGAWVQSLRRLYTTMFERLATDVVWHREKAGELAMWLLESVHRTTLGAALRGDPLATDDELDALLEQLARAEGESDAAVAADARSAAVERFTHARDAALLLDAVDLAAVRRALGSGVGLVYHCSRDGAGWSVGGVLISPTLGEATFFSRIDDGDASELLSAITDRRHAAVKAAFGVPLWDDLWTALARSILPETLGDELRSAARDGGRACLVIVPDGPLASLPFPGLHVDGVALAELADVQLTPSLTLLSADVGDERGGSGVIVTQVDERVLAGAAAPAWVGEVRSSATRAEFELALGTLPRPDLAVILAHGQAGRSVTDNVILMGDASLSAISALRLPWPPAVILGNCWIGAGEVNAGEEPFGFPIACLMNGARTVVGAVTPTPATGVVRLLHSVAARLPTGASLSLAVREAVLPPPGAERERWRDAPPMDWACLAVWSTVAPASRPRKDRPQHWDADGMPTAREHASDVAPVRFRAPADLALDRVLRAAAARAQATVSAADVLEAAVDVDPIARDLPDARAAVKHVSEPATDTPDRVVCVGSGAPLVLSPAVFEAVRASAAAAACAGRTSMSLWPLLAELCFLLDAAPEVERFGQAVFDRAGREAESGGDGLKLGDYDAARVEWLGSDMTLSPLKGLRTARRVLWCAAFVVLLLVGTALTSARDIDQMLLTRGYLGVHIVGAPGEPVSVGGVENGSPAAGARLRPGEVIRSIDGIPVTGAAETVLRIRAHRPGTEIRLVVYDGVEERTVVTRTAKLP